MHAIPSIVCSSAARLRCVALRQWMGAQILIVALGAAVASVALPALACTGDCHGDGEVGVDEILIMVNIALNNLPLAACAAGDANADRQITVDEILAAVGNALNGCAPASSIVDFGLAFGGGPGGTTFLPLTLSANNIVMVTVDLCFVDSVFTFSSDQTFASQDVSLTNVTVLDSPCALRDTRFPTGRQFHAEISGDAGQPIPSGQFVTLAFNSSDSAAPGCYPAQLQATLQTSDGKTIINSASGTLAVFAFQGDSCNTDCGCNTGFCRNGVCCDTDCSNGTCNTPDAVGTCVSQ